MGVRILALLLCLLGGGMLFKSFWIEAKAWLAEGLIETAWQHTLAGEGPTAPWPWADTWPVARLESPRLGITRLVLNGDSGAAMAFGPGWTEHTTLPGEEGRSFISGHRDTHFRFLKDLLIGDELKVQRADGKIVVFRVAESQIVDQQQGWHISLEGPQELLLVTCYPFDAVMPGGPMRYIVRAEKTVESGGPHIPYPEDI
ncbi:MAG: class GN sortase [Candidatus Thiodiazotropha sp. LLP2]